MRFTFVLAILLATAVPARAGDELTFQKRAQLPSNFMIDSAYSLDRVEMSRPDQMTITVSTITITRLAALERLTREQDQTIKELTARLVELEKSPIFHLKPASNVQLLEPR